MSYPRDWRKTWHTVDSGTKLSSGYTDSVGLKTVARIGLWALKDKLTAPGLGAWTVVASSGKAGGASLVANTDDNWLTSDDLVWAVNDTSDRSWVVLKSPDRREGSFYIVLDYWSPDEYRIQMYFTKSCPDVSSPVVNARPPVTGNEWSYANFYSVCSADYGGSAELQSFAGRATDGSFFIVLNRTPNWSVLTVGEWSGLYTTVYIFNVISNKKAWDTVGAVSMIYTNLNTPPSYQWGMGFKTLHSDGSVVSVSPIFLSCYGVANLRQTHTDPWDGGYYNEPVWLVSTTAGKQCIRGALEDIRWAPMSLADGMVVFSNQIPKAVKVGIFYLPTDQAVALL